MDYERGYDDGFSDGATEHKDWLNAWVTRAEEALADRDNMREMSLADVVNEMIAWIGEQE